MISNIINYIRYRKFIDENKKELTDEFDIRVDNLYRLGSVISINPKKMDLLRDYREAEMDVHQQLDLEVRRYISKLDRYFMLRNLVEYVGLSDVQRVSDNRVTVVMSYRLMNVVRVANATRIISILSLISLFSGFFGLIFMIPGASLFILTVLFNYILFRKLFV